MVKLRRGFTLIELMVVLTIVALLLSLAVPRYFNSVQRSKETVLRANLATTRDAIDKFYGDRGRYPESLDQLVEFKYLRSVPVDPLTESAATWAIVAPPQSDRSGAVFDLHSGALGQSASGEKYGEW
jgi:general secretion pathway protein G